MIEIKKLSPDEWQKYRDIRLEALKMDPNSFSSTYEREINFTEVDWRSRSENMRVALINGQAVGMIGLITNTLQSTKHNALIVSFWVKPDFRRQGLGRQLIVKLQEEASDLCLRKLWLTVTTTKREAIRLYEKLGFKHVGLLKDNLRKGDIFLDEFLMEWFAPPQ